MEFSEEAFDDFFEVEEPGIYLLVLNSKGAIIHSTEEDLRRRPLKTERFDLKISKALLDKEPETLDFDGLVGRLMSYSSQNDDRIDKD